MALVFGVGIGALLFLVGVLTYFLAPRVGPNPIFGVRVGYSFASREIWDRTNRAGGVLFAAVGLGTVFLALALRWLGVPDNLALIVMTGAMFIALISAIGWLVAYARKQAQGSLLALETAPVPFRWSALAPTFITSLVLVALIAYFYPQLPANRIATHFDFSDQPNGWMTRDEFFISMFGLAALFVAIDLLVVWVATREPLIAIMRWGSRWQMQPGRGLLFIGMMMGLGNIVLALAVWDIGWFNTRGAHPFSLAVLPVLTVALAGLIIVLFFILGTRARAATDHD